MTEFTIERCTWTTGTYNRGPIRDSYVTMVVHADTQPAAIDRATEISGGSSPRQALRYSFKVVSAREMA